MNWRICFLRTIYQVRHIGGIQMLSAIILLIVQEKNMIDVMKIIGQLSK